MKIPEVDTYSIKNEFEVHTTYLDVLENRILKLYTFLFSADPYFFLSNCKYVSKYKIIFYKFILLETKPCDWFLTFQDTCYGNFSENFKLKICIPKMPSKHVHIFHSNLKYTIKYTHTNMC